MGLAEFCWWVLYDDICTGRRSEKPLCLFLGLFWLVGVFFVGFFVLVGLWGFFGLFLDFVCINFLLFFKMGELSFLFYL